MDLNEFIRTLSGEIPKNDEGLYDRYVITHPALGLFIGSTLGGMIWSLIDPCEMYSAVVFQSPEVAGQFVATCPMSIACQLVLHKVETSTPSYASIAELQKATPEIPENMLSVLYPYKPH